MAVIKCKMCGGDIVLNEEKTYGICDYCGSTMTLPKVSDDQRAARFNRGNHFRRQGEFDRALAVYESIVREDDNDAEAHWCCALCRFGIEYVEDPNTYEYIPTCHRASFDSFLEDVDYLAALEYSDGITRRQYQKEAAKIAEVQRGILATSQNEQPFDVFICYKETDDDTKERTRDSLDAQEIYYQLTQAGYRTFFSRITLEDKIGTEYEPYIFAALNSAKVMVALGTKSEYFNAVWVKNEWSRFLSMMRKDRSKLLLPCYKGMDPYDLPEQLSVLQSYDMAKIGFMQDLIRGIKKVLQKEEAKTSLSQQVIIQQTAASSGPNINALLKRGEQSLEDKDWNEATRFYDQALNLDAESAHAFFGKALAANHCANTEAFIKMWLSIPESEAEQLIACEHDQEWINRVKAENVVYGLIKEEDFDKCFVNDDRTFMSMTKAWHDRIANELTYWENDRYMSRAVRYAKDDFSELLESIQNRIKTGLQANLKDSEELDERRKAEIVQQYKENMMRAENDAKLIRMKALTAKRQRDQNDLLSQIEWEKKKLENYRNEMSELDHSSGFFAGKQKQRKRRFELEERIAIQEREINSLQKKYDSVEALIIEES